VSGLFHRRVRADATDQRKVTTRQTCMTLDK
jgi:hypothetical protein